MRSSLIPVLLLTLGCTGTAVKTGRQPESTVTEFHMNGAKQEDLLFGPIKLLPNKSTSGTEKREPTSDGTRVQNPQLTPRADPLANALLLDPKKTIDEFLATPLEIPLDENGVPLPIPVPSEGASE